MGPRQASTKWEGRDEGRFGETHSCDAGHVVATLTESTDRLHADGLGTREDPISVIDWDALGTPLSVPKMS